MVFDKVIKYNSCILHSWIKSLKSGTLRYCIFIARFLEASREPQVRHVSEGCVKFLARSPVHLCTLAAAPCALQTSSIKRLSLLLSSSSCLKAEQEREADPDLGHICSLVCTCILEVDIWPHWTSSPQCVHSTPKPHGCNRSIPGTGLLPSSPWCTASVLDKDQSWA